MDGNKPSTTMQPANQPAVPIDDMMKYHVYIGYSQQNKVQAKILHGLIKKSGLCCMCRSSLDVEEVSKLLNIKQGVPFSHRCILIVTRDYLKDDDSKHELMEAERKVKYLGQNSVVALVDSSVPGEELEKLKQKFKVIGVELNQYCNLNEHHLLSAETSFVQFLQFDFQPTPMLSSMPKENLGAGVAYTYFFGYLQLILPDIGESLKNQLENQKQYPVDLKRVVNKFLIIIPEDVNSPPEFMYETATKILTQTKLKIRIKANRAGRQGRDFSVPVNELAMQDGRLDKFYFVGDMPACLYALYEAHIWGTVSMTVNELHQARNEFILCLKAFLTHPDQRKRFENQWEILFWPNLPDNPKRIELPEFLHEQIISKKLTEKIEDMTASSISDPEPPRPKTFVLLPAKKNQDSRTYCGYPRYELRSENRGHCVIINNSKFSDGFKLRERTGAANENAMLQQLFTQLHFSVRTEQDQSEEQMMKLLNSYRDNSVQSNCDAFVCCILSHGTMGHIMSADDRKVMIMNLMELFNEKYCPSLKGKPKMFFIEACQNKSTAQTEDPEPMDTNACRLSTAANPDGGSFSDGELIPPWVDFIVSFAAMPYQLSYADTVSGGLYTQALCKFLRTDKEIDLALRAVNREVKMLLERYPKENNKTRQQETFHCITGCDKLLFLNDN